MLIPDVAVEFEATVLGEEKKKVVILGKGRL